MLRSTAATLQRRRPHHLTADASKFAAHYLALTLTSLKWEKISAALVVVMGATETPAAAITTTTTTAITQPSGEPCGTSK